MEDKKLDNLNENSESLENTASQESAEETAATVENAVDEALSGESDAAAAAAESPLTGKQKFWKEVREWIVSIAVALLVVFVLRSFLFNIIYVDDLVAYVRSTKSFAYVRSWPEEALRQRLMAEMENGVIRIPKEYGVFQCYEPIVTKIFD